MDCNLLGFSIYGILHARILEWIAISFSRVSSEPRDWTWVSCIAVRFFTNWTMREAHRCMGRLNIWDMKYLVWCGLGWDFIFILLFIKHQVFPLSQKLQGSQFSSVQLLNCVWLCDPINCSTPGLPVHHQLPEFTQTHNHQVRDAIQPSHPLLSPSPSALNPS